MLKFKQEGDDLIIVHHAGKIIISKTDTGHYRFTYLKPNASIPSLIRTIVPSMLWYEYQQLTTGDPGSKPFIDPKSMSLGRFLYLLSKPEVHFYLDGFDWALSSDGHLYNRQPDDRLAETDVEVAMIHTQILGIKAKYSLIK